MLSPKWGIVLVLMVVSCVLIEGARRTMWSRSHSIDLSDRIPSEYLTTEDSMRRKIHGTCVQSIQERLRWNVDVDEADEIACFNRKYAEFPGYFEVVSKFLNQVKQLSASSKEGDSKTLVFRDSVTGEALFQVPGRKAQRSLLEFLRESYVHGWPSFRDDEVLWDSSGVRMLKNGEMVNIHSGAHLGHNIPDEHIGADGKRQVRNRFCINLVTIAGTDDMLKFEEL